MARLDGKVALITGSTGGMGAGMAAAFAAEGAAVTVSGRNEEAGEAVAAEIRDAGGRADYVRLDVADADSVRAAVDATVAAFGGLDVLVNNAAATDAIVGGLDGACADVTAEGFDTILRVGLYGPYLCCREAIPRMLERDGGSIINISSAAAVEGVPRTFAYACSKGGLSAMSRELAIDYGPSGIRANTITAGFIVTNPIAEMLAAHPAFEAVKVTPRFGRPDDVARCAVYLASDESEFVTGTAIAIDGGLTAKSAFPDPTALFAQA